MRGERRLRFACGAIAGSFAGCHFGPMLVDRPWTGIVIGVTAVAFGFAAAFMGDSFWRGLRWW